MLPNPVGACQLTTDAHSRILKRMPFLLYCVIDAAARIEPPARGVRDAAIESVIESGLRCFYSEVPSVQGEAAVVRDDALVFHQVIHRIFTAATILPFRYPTLLPSLADVGAHLRHRAAQYNSALLSLAGKAQMDVRIAWAGTDQQASGGAEYLRRKAARDREINAAVSALRVAAGDKVLDWRQRETPQGARCFALLRRDDVCDFQQQLRQLRLDPEVNVTVSGPWPPAEFLPEFND
ncbi:MAG: GvpL/GvpF family gas vesicle protein [Terriglobales bacterium]